MTANNDLHVVIGAGPLGLATAGALAARGRRVRVVNRSGKMPIPAGVEAAAADAADPDEARRVCTGAAVVYHCANPPYARWEAQFPGLQAAILQAAEVAGAKLVIGENLYMYGAVDGPIHEGLPYAAHTRKGKLRARLADEALAAHRAGRVRVAIGRGSDFFGPHVRGSAVGERVFVPALQGKTASLLGRLDLPHTFTYIEDFGQALATLGEREEALGEAWHVPNPETVTQGEFVELIAAELGRPVRASGMGRVMMRLGGLFVPEARESVEMMYQFERPFVVDSSKYARAFGEAATPLREAIRRTVAWWDSL